MREPAAWPDTCRQAGPGLRSACGSAAWRSRLRGRYRSCTIGAAIDSATAKSPISRMTLLPRRNRRSTSSAPKPAASDKKHHRQHAVTCRHAQAVESRHVPVEERVQAPCPAERPSHRPDFRSEREQERRQSARAARNPATEPAQAAANDRARGERTQQQPRAPTSRICKFRDETPDADRQRPDLAQSRGRSRIKHEKQRVQRAACRDDDTRRSSGRGTTAAGPCDRAPTLARRRRPGRRQRAQARLSEGRGRLQPSGTRGSCRPHSRDSAGDVQ